MVEPRRAIETLPATEADALSGERAFVVAALRDGTPLLVSTS
jgi:hypothetical protein